MKMEETAREPVLVDLALQGGGSHGAFTWGVLDRLIEEPWLRIEAISGTSAGAMNAALVADGWTQGGAAAIDVGTDRDTTMRTIPQPRTVMITRQLAHHQLCRLTIARPVAAYKSRITCSHLSRLHGNRLAGKSAA
jgi:predicted acylesterase/phospholipase RssA